ncbi:tastin isoform X2 [Heterocephalus glaber]|uniref:Tastin isoform X2 n=1 Tax=Heterocephalus glaber TaxID=10181 RepID=A0AAX6RPQ3_HETGA|nr:tastin isoform X2 [Heterocephalus glaber]
MRPAGAQREMSTAMTTIQATKDPLLRGVSPTPSKIPVRCQRRPPFPTVKSSTQDQENQDPRSLVQKPPLSIQHTLVDSAGGRSKAIHQTEKSQKLMAITQLRNPLEELRPSHVGQNVGLRPPPQTEAPGAIEFVADPAALATILSGEGVKSYPMGRQSSLAQRVLVRGNQGGTVRRGQGAWASVYVAPRTPIHQLGPARASCFSRLEGSGPRGQTFCPQMRLEAQVSALEGLMFCASGSFLPGTVLGPGSQGVLLGGWSWWQSPKVWGPPLTLLFSLAPMDQVPSSRSSFHPSTRPSLQDLRREIGGSNRTSVSQASGLHLETPVQPASLLEEHESVPHSDEGGGALLGLAQRVPVRETRERIHTGDAQDSHLMPSPAPEAQRVRGRVVPPSVTHPSPFGRAQRVHSPGFPALTSYSLLRRLGIQPKTQFTPSTPRVQQAQWLSGLTPQSCTEEPALPWEQIAVRLFDQDSGVRLQEQPGKPAVASPGSHPYRTFNFQELKMQRISILQQLLRQEVEGLAVGKYAPPNGDSSLDMVEFHPLLAEISRTLKAPGHNSGTSYLPGLSQHPELPEPCPPEECEEPPPCFGAEPEVTQPCPPAETGPPESCSKARPGIPAPSSREQPEVAEPCPPAESGLLQPRPQGQTASKKACPRIELRASEAHSLEPKSLESSPWRCCSQGAPATTSPPICSLQSPRPPTGQAGPGQLAPRTLALRQRLKACLTAIHCSHEARLDDECAFYTSRVPPPGPTRVCTNPVATVLEWQDALCFIPVGSAAPQSSPY